MNTFVKAGLEDEWMKENTAAGYANHHIWLNEKDVEALKAGEVLVTGNEYGVAIQWEQTITHMLVEADESGVRFLETLCGETKRRYRPNEWIQWGLCFTTDPDLITCSRCLEAMKGEASDE